MTIKTCPCDEERGANLPSCQNVTFCMWETNIHFHLHQDLLQYVFMLSRPLCIILCGLDQQSTMVTFTRNQPDEWLDIHYPSVSPQSRSDRPPLISHPLQSADLRLFTWIKFAWPLLRFKDEARLLSKTKTNCVGLFFELKLWFLFVGPWMWMDC